MYSVLHSNSIRNVQRYLDFKRKENTYIMVKIDYKSPKDADGITAHTMNNRPTSPHIQIYKWEWTMLYSILHRMTAMGCFVLGILGLVAIIGLHVFPHTLGYAVTYLLQSYLGYGIVFMACLSVGYFICADIKYMIWGRAWGLQLHRARHMGNLTAMGALIIATGGVVCFFI